MVTDWSMLGALVALFLQREVHAGRLTGRFAYVHWGVLSAAVLGGLMELAVLVGSLL